MTTKGGAVAGRSLTTTGMNIEERIFQGERTGCLWSLMGDGLSPNLASRWCETWEEEGPLQIGTSADAYWAEGQRWIRYQIGAKRSPLPASAWQGPPIHKAGNGLATMTAMMLRDRPESRWMQPAFRRNTLWLVVLIVAAVVGAEVAAADFL